MRIVVIGYKGLLGGELSALLKDKGEELLLLDKGDVDVNDPGSLKEKIAPFKPDAIIDLAALSDVDKCEEEPQAALKTNGEGAKNCALLAKELGAKSLYIGSDYVFDGTKEGSYETEDPYSPRSAYGRSKALGEKNTLENNPRSFVVRTGWLYGPYGTTFVDTMIEKAKKGEPLKVIDDQFGSPTYTYDLCLFLHELLKSEKYGLYHATNEGFLSWYDFLVMALKKKGLDNLIQKSHADELGFKAFRPHNCRLSKACLKRNGFARLPSVDDALERYLERKGI